MSSDKRKGALSEERKMYLEGEFMKMKAINLRQHRLGRGQLANRMR